MQAGILCVRRNGSTPAAGELGTVFVAFFMLVSVRHHRQLDAVST